MDAVDLPITTDNVRDWFPAPPTENPFAADAWWQLQSLGLLAAVQMLRLVPAGTIQQQALVGLRQVIDTALLAVPMPSDATIRLRTAQTLAPYYPSPMTVVDKMLELAQLTPEDHLFDVGSGDGRIVFEALKRGAGKATGIEIDAGLVAAASARRIEHPAFEVADFVEGDALLADLTPATVVTCYLLSSSMATLAKKFKTLRQGTRIISHDFAMPGWPPSRAVRVGESTVFLWVVS